MVATFSISAAKFFTTSIIESKSLPKVSATIVCDSVWVFSHVIAKGDRYVYLADDTVDALDHRLQQVSQGLPRFCIVGIGEQYSIQNILCGILEGNVIVLYCFD